MIPIRDSVRSHTFPIVNIVIILANAAMFIHELGMAGSGQLEAFLQSHAVIPARLLGEPAAAWSTVFTAMFLHGGWSHLIGNMLYLWIFGDNVEDRLGHFRYLVFYLLLGTCATFVQAFVAPQSRIPMIGASGAIAGILGAYFVLYPNARVLTLVPIWVFVRVVELPAFMLLGLWFVVQYFQGLGSITQQRVQGDVGGVAWWAHAGGFVAGLILVWFFKKRGRASR